MDDNMPKSEIDIKSLQKTSFIFTVNLDHIRKGLKDEPQIVQLEELRLHHMIMSNFPNVELLRAQIEKNQKGVLHINGGIKLKSPIRARTLENKIGGWFEPARNSEAVMNYGRKQDTRYELLPNVGTLKVKATALPTPKAQAIEMLLAGMNPQEICRTAPDVFFTHHRAILETWKMLGYKYIAHSPILWRSE